MRPTLSVDTFWIAYYLEYFCLANQWPATRQQKLGICRGCDAFERMNCILWNKLSFGLILLMKPSQCWHAFWAIDPFSMSCPVTFTSSPLFAIAAAEKNSLVVGRQRTISSRNRIVPNLLPSTRTTTDPIRKRQKQKRPATILEPWRLHSALPKS